MADRVTQTVIEAAILPVNKARATQTVIEAGIIPANKARVTQTVIEVMYPTPSPYPDGTLFAGPVINRIQDQPVEYEVDKIEYEDGGVDVNVQPCGMKRWVLEYEGLTQAELAVIMNHFNGAKGQVISFNFYHKRDAVVYTNVNYERFEVGKHAKSWSVPAIVVLRKLL